MICLIKLYKVFILTLYFTLGINFAIIVDITILLICFNHLHYLLLEINLNILFPPKPLTPSTNQQ